MKIGRFLPFLLLPLFIIFTLILNQPAMHFSTDHSHSSFKTELIVEKEAGGSVTPDDKKKPLFTTELTSIIQIIVVYILFISSAVLSIQFLYKFFLTPVFYQSNYVIQAPLFLNKK